VIEFGENIELLNKLNRCMEKNEMSKKHQAPHLRRGYGGQASSQASAFAGRFHLRPSGYGGQDGGQAREAPNINDQKTIFKRAFGGKPELGKKGGTLLDIVSLGVA
jgi:hypothetical protein